MYSELNEPPEHMLVTSNGRFLNPFRALQVYEEIGAPNKLFCNFGEWELPVGATAEIVHGEPTISFPHELSGQLNRLYDRFVSPKEISGHINPGAPEEGAGRLYQFVGKLSLDSADYEGYEASIFFRVSGWPFGARRRGNDEKKRYVCPGDPFCMLNIRSRDYGQISARGWRPPSELEWKTSKPYSY